MDVEVLVDGTWIDGHLLPIAKGVVVLQPISEAAAFYGPTSMKADVIQAIRQVKKPTFTTDIPTNEQITETLAAPKPVRSSLEQNTPGHFVIAKETRR